MLLIHLRCQPSIAVEVENRLGGNMHRHNDLIINWILQALRKCQLAGSVQQLDLKLEAPGTSSLRLISGPWVLSALTDWSYWCVHQS